jgi:hypothetical protein
MEKFKVGDTVWLASYSSKEVIKPCPSCFGKKEVKLTLGNGDEVMLPCAGCAPGFDPPTGYSIEYEYSTAPRLIVIDKVTTEVNGSTETVTSGSDCYVLDAEKVFSNQEDARVFGEGLRLQAEREQLTRAEWIKKDKHRSFSWNAHYHLNQVKRLEKEIERHKAQATACKERARSTPQE